MLGAVARETAFCYIYIVWGNYLHVYPKPTIITDPQHHVSRRRTLI